MPRTNARSRALIDAADRLRDAVDRLNFAPPVTHIYNPLRYAWKSHQAYLRMAPKGDVNAVFLGMNPGPWGMAQTGVPFGEIQLVKDFLKINEPVDRPTLENPKRPVEGFDCPRSEVSGRRLWGYFRDQFQTAQRFFDEHFVTNYCPLVFMESGGRNRTPDKLPVGERLPLQQCCDQHLREVLDILRPRYVVAVGTFAEACVKRCRDDLAKSDVSKGSDSATPWSLVRILHPSPASPAANRDWAGTVHRQLCEAAVLDGKEHTT
ncbi:uracil-DNA glycosylase family protein [Crateriforma conspicua]|uniref:Uracil DNA glycosylase superfamily protein n=1 Tax=Crateriforma conspicua TaxID=2527996 RepID=A0A5C5XST2_9PLAN|nr:uracil-DNA glycosylase family protein [Crateriforma conspicua]QDV66191.1 Uracil DNA glycosylase superfamily protein [Crateriforma conspicua]TWT65591.1 Uracil DNA glycosylase superfamily protein [Crateriforma conspicua]